MATQQNKLLPIVGGIGVVIIAVILWQQFKARPERVKATAPLGAVPQPAALPKSRGADADNASETLAQVVASNKEMRERMDKILENDERIMAENKRLREGATNATTPNSDPNAAPGSGAIDRARGVVDNTLDSAGRAAQAFLNGPGAVTRPGRAAGTANAGAASANGEVVIASNGQGGDPNANPGAPSGAYKTVAPMGYAQVDDNRAGNQGKAQTRFVRTMAGADGARATGGASPAGAPEKPRDAALDYAYFTIPENSTLVGVQAMTSIIGRVPIDGRVTDPMQFKAIVGRDNLAANGWELPQDLAGMIITGVAIGDMALSCSEGKIRSLTFVFNDGTIRTVSSRSRSSGALGSTAAGGSTGGDLGFVSDSYGNPCVAGKFVTNAPRYLTDIVGLKSLGIASQAYSAAAQQTTQNALGGNTTSVTNTNNYVLGQAVAGATDEVTQWMLQRLKNSFDAVVTPAGQRLVVHLDQEIRLDKAPDARRIVHRFQTASQATRGTNHGLE